MFISLPSNFIQEITNQFNELWQDLAPVLPFIIGIWIAWWVIEHIILWFDMRKYERELREK
jgi:hypothetical protein